MAKKEESLLFVGITNGSELRRDVLESSKEILESLKEYERFKSTRDEKLRLINQFRDDIKGVSKLISQLRVNLPKIKDLPKTKEPEIKAPEVKKPKKEEKARVEPRQKTELERLEDELNEIESKLNSLS